MGQKVRPNEKAMSQISAADLKVWAAAKGHGERKRAQKANNELVKRGIK